MESGHVKTENSEVRWGKVVVGHGSWDSGGMDPNNNLDDISDDNNNVWHYWRSYCATAHFLHFSLYSP